MSTKWEALTEQLEARCKAAGLVANEQSSEEEFFGWFVRPIDEGGSSAHLEASSGLDTHEEGIEFALNSRFEHYRFLEAFTGAWSAVDDVVEAEVQGSSSPLMSRVGVVETIVRNHRRHKDQGRNSEEPPNDSLVFPTGNPGVLVELRYACAETLVWRSADPDSHTIDTTGRIPVIRIKGAQLKTREQAVAAVESYGLAALMELDTSLGWTVQLEIPHPVSLRFHTENRRSFGALEKVPQREPVLLFLHARAQGNDIVSRFLSFYHVLEFFFPRLSYVDKASELHGRVPAVQVDQIVSLLKAQHGERGVGKEEDQLILTVKHAVATTDLETLLRQDQELQRFYAQPDMPIVDNRVDIRAGTRGGKKQGDVRKQMAKRLYAIRNRIVHKKESSEAVLLPFSPEVADLYEDVRILELLARRLIEKESVPLPSAL